jgi:hypothetical protein
MTRDDILRMAKEAGLAPASFCRWSAYSDDLERFATLVAAEKEQQMIRDGWRQCAEGQRTTQHCKLLDAAVKAERKACVIACEKISESLYSYDNITEGRAAQDCANAIRARRET